MKKPFVFRLVISGVMLALAFVLSFVKIPWLPYGGSVTLFSMVPIVFIGCMYGPAWGLLVANVYSLLQLFQSAVFSQAFVGQNAGQVVLMLLFDFIFAFTVLGLGGMFVTKKRISEKSDARIAGAGAAGAAIVCLARYACHTISGYILFGQYAEWFFTDEWVNPVGNWIMGTFSGKALAFVYSLVYNGLYMIPTKKASCATNLFSVFTPAMSCANWLPRQTCISIAQPLRWRDFPHWKPSNRP